MAHFGQYEEFCMKKFLWLLIVLLGLNCLPSFAEEVNMTIEKQRQEHINEIGFKILNSNKIEKRMVFQYIPNNRSINAGTYYRDRKIVLYRGLYNYIDNDDEYAAILSHEISHGVDYYDGILKGFFSFIPTTLASKKYEKKADKRAVDYMVKAGYNPVALIVVMSKTFSQPRYDWFFWVSHPLTSKRMAYIYEYIYTKYPSYLANNEYKNNAYYQNFLITSRANRLKLQEKIENHDKKHSKVNYL